MIQAIFFDIGGTLRVVQKIEGRDPLVIREMMDFLGESGDARAFVRRLRVREKQYSVWSQRTQIELNAAELWTRFFLPEYPADFVRANAVTLNQTWRRSKGTRHLLPDSLETLRELAKRGYQLGIISNTTSEVEVPALLEEHGIAHLFPTVILSASFGRRKPHPSLFLAAARQAGVLPHECAYVGDRPSRDVVGAREAGFAEVVIIEADGNGPDATPVLMQPDHVIRRLSGLLPLFPGPDRRPARRNGSSPDTLYDAALSTMWNVKQPQPFAETFRAPREIGFARFELNHAVRADLFNAIDARHTPIGSVHDPCPAGVPLDTLKEWDWQIASLDEMRRGQGVAMAKRTVDLAVQLGARLVVIHPGNIVADPALDYRLRDLYLAGEAHTPAYAALRDELMADRAQRAAPHLEAARRSLREIIDYALPLGVILGLENRYRYYDIPILDEMEALLELSDAEGYGFQYDVGHAETLDRLGLCAHMDWLERFGRRMVGMHLHDVNGLTDHRVPGDGSVNFAKIAPYLPPTARRTLEVSAKYTLPQIRAGLDLLAGAGCVIKL